MYDRFNIPDYVYRINSLIGDNGYLVGGCIRDMLLGRLAHDYDMTSFLLPEIATQLLAGHADVNPIGIKYGTIQIIMPDAEPVELTTFRTDGNYGDGRRPDNVTFGNFIHEDLERRDFTMNALAYNITTGNLLDYHGGRQDIQDRIIRFVGDPDTRIQEDALRMLRAFRFASQLGFSIERDALAAIFHNAQLIKNVARERISAEWMKICQGNCVAEVLLCMKHCGLLEYIVPEMKATYDCIQDGWHHLDVLKHSIMTVKMLEKSIHNSAEYGTLGMWFSSVYNDPKRRAILMTAAVIHDIGKPITRTLDTETGAYHFYNHDNAGADLVPVIAERMKLSSVECRTLQTLVKLHMQLHHMHHNGVNPSKRQMRRFLDESGPLLWQELMMLTLADTQSACSVKSRVPEEVVELHVMYKYIIDYFINVYNPLSITPLVNGNDLIALGMVSGPKIGTVLRNVVEKASEGEIVTFEDAISWVKQEYSELLLR